LEARLFKEVKALFDRAVELPPSERADFIAGSGAHPQVRAEVERLLFQDTANAGQGALRESGRTISHYRLKRKLGEGGMGEVWLADDLALDRPAAIKLLRNELNVALRARLRREAEAGARLQHPGIATFLEAGDEAGTTWLAMEYVEGSTLRDRLKGGRLPTDEALPIGAGLLEALVHAHTAGVLHRDIKPENVMLTGDRRVKLLDFGLAKWTEEEAEQALDPSLPTATALTALTKHGTVAGTLGYMSPEQLRGEPVDVRTDLFAVGAVLYEMLAGRPTFPGANVQQRMASVLSLDPAPLAGPDIPPGLNDVLQRALARDATARYPDAPSLLEDLRRVSEGLAVAEVPNSLAILAFDNLSDNTDDDWIGTAVAESLASDLGRVSGLQVLPREKVIAVRATLAAEGEPFAPLKVGRLLGSHLVLTGSVQRMGPTVRLTTRLSRTGTGEIVATEKFDGKVEDLFALQDRLAAAVAASLNLDAATIETTQALDAFECYNRGKALLFNFGKERMQQAGELYERSLELDPEYVPALADLSMMHAMRFTFTSDPSVLETAADYALRALRRDPFNSIARAWLGYSLWRQERHEEALAEELRAIELAPDHYMAPYFAAAVLTDMGRAAEGIPYAQSSVKLFSDWAWGYGLLAWCHLASGNRSEARWSAERCVEVQDAPGAHPYPLAHILLAECQRRLGDFDEARQSTFLGLERVERTDHAYRDSGRASGLSVLGRVALDQNDLAGALAALDQAVAQMRGRPTGIGVGHVMVQSLAGQTRAGAGPAPFEEALELFEKREGFNFSWALIGSNEISLNELALAATALGRDRLASELLERARQAGLSGLLETTL